MVKTTVYLDSEIVLSLRQMAASQGRKQAMQHWHLPEYWRKHGFPPQCRPMGELDFECP